MGRRAVGEAGALAREVSAVVSLLREQRGIENQQLFTAAGMSASYYYVRMRGDAAFGLSDVEQLSTVLGIHWLELFRLAAKRLSGSTDEMDAIALVDRHELSQRLANLTVAQRADGSRFSWSDLESLADAQGVAFTKQNLDDLLSASPDVEIRERWLKLMAQFWGIPEDYLLDPENDEAVDMVDAQLDFRAALEASGAASVSARALSDVSPTALRALTRSLRNIPS